MIHIILTILKTTIIMIDTPQLINIEVDSHKWAKTMKEFLEDSIQEVEVIGLSTDNNHMWIKDFKDEHIREVEIKTAIATGDSLVINLRTWTEGELVQTPINQEGTLEADLITAQMLINSINITCTSSKQSNMAPHVAYAEAIITPPNTVTKVNMT